MKLKTLQVYNFRQFYGKTPKIQFSSGDRNVTVIHGMNGSGKTAILNAFTWILYKVFSKGFHEPNQLINKRAIRESNGESVKVWGELSFEHQGYDYFVRRSATGTIFGSEIEIEEEEPTIRINKITGKSVEADSFKSAVEKVLPKDLYPYFFFDGERIERIVAPTKEDRSDLTKATKKLIGVEVLERSIRHLSVAKDEFEKEQQKGGDTKSTELSEQIVAIQKEIEKVKTEKSDINIELDAARTLESEVEDKLKKLEEAKSIQEERDQLQTQLEEAGTLLESEEKKLKQEINTHGYSVFLKKAADQFKDLIESLRKKGELPSGIKKQFIQDLLEREECICGCSLSAASTNARAKVEGWYQIAGTESVEEAAMMMRGEITKIEDSIPQFWDRVGRNQESIRSTEKRMAKIREQLVELSNQLQNSPKEEIKGLERRRIEISDQIDGCNRDIGRCDEQLRKINDDLDQLEQKRRESQSKDQRQELARRRIVVTIEAIKSIEASLKNVGALWRTKLEKEIQRLFSEISVTPYVPKLEEDFTVDLHESAGGPLTKVGKSTGESLVLSFSYIAAIIEKTREFAKRHEEVMPTDAISYPLIMDSPFGSLDGGNRTHIAKQVSSLADQVVVLVSKTQWRHEVESALSGKIGKQYALKYFTPKADFRQEFVEIKNKEIQLVVKSPNDYEYTELIEV